MDRLCGLVRLTAIACIVVGSTNTVAAPPSAADILRFQPKQQGVVITTPVDAELASCKVELVNGPGTASGWSLKDGRGMVVRKFVATKGAKAAIDIWSYYLDGQEVYREIDTQGKGKPDQFRWFGPGGMRWGVDVNQDGRIDGWRQISAEEVSQELLKAVITRDAGRFQALLINDAELKAIDIGQADADRYRQTMAQATGKFTQVASAMSGLNDKTQWVHLEATAPQCVSAEQSGGKNDLVRYKNASVLFENSGKHDWITIGEIVQVGRAWRLVAAPTPGNTAGDADVTSNPNPAAPVPDAAKPLVEELRKIDQNAPKPGDKPEVVAKYNSQRAAVLEKILPTVSVAEREQWVKQLADCYSSAAQNNPSDKTVMTKLTALKDKIVKEQPGTPIAGYVVFREMSVEYTAKIQGGLKNDELAKAQEAWRDKLKGFVDAYPSSEDAPDAALQYGMVSEFMGKESDAKMIYTKMVKDYGTHTNAQKAAGALARLDLDGKPLELAGPTLSGGQFNIAQLQGKPVIVYYWASWNGQCASDFAKLLMISKAFGDKGVTVVTVNLDNTAGEASSFLQRAQFPGTHLHMPGGMESPLAVRYGIMVLPNLFIVGKDGKVVNRTVQMSSLEDEVKKLTDK